MLCFRFIIKHVKYEKMEPGVLLGPCPICPEADASQVSPASQEVSLGKMPSGMGLIYFPTFSKVWSLTLSFFRFEFSRLSLNEAIQHLPTLVLPSSKSSDWQLSSWQIIYILSRENKWNCIIDHTCRFVALQRPYTPDPIIHQIRVAYVWVLQVPPFGAP